MIMIPTAIIFSRYRAFRNRIRLDLAPLTVIIGKNGGGKSVLTRLPLLLASGLSSRADAALDLMAGGIVHAARFEDLIYQRSAQPFSLGAEISDGKRTLGFESTFRHVVERHEIALESFELMENGTPAVRLELANLDDIGRPTARFAVTVGADRAEYNVSATLIGLFPSAIDGNAGASRRLQDARMLFEEAFAQPSYLGPFRSEVGSLPRIPRQGVRDLGPRGEYALDILGDDALRGTGALVRDVEEWFEAAMDGNRVKLERRGDLPRMLVHDPLRNVDVDLAETGVGFAQVFPIVVQAFARQASRIKSSFLIVEQPELHLHPAAHGSVADLIVETVIQCGMNIRYLCETHSEQIVTRIRRRVAEGTIAADAIKIISVGHRSGLDAEVEPLRSIAVDPFGNPDAWPDGVFDEVFDDLVYLREAARRRAADDVGLSQ